MTSYAKQMMGVANEWLLANVDPYDVLLKIPRSSTRKDAMWSSWIEETNHIVEKRPELLSSVGPLVDDVKLAITTRDRTAVELRDAEDQLEKILNRGINPSTSKHKVDQSLHSDIGRWCLAWARHGYNVIDMSADFVAAMLLTDARDLDIASIRMPFCGLLMTIPQGFARGAEGYSYTKIHVAELPGSTLDKLEVTPEVMSAMAALDKNTAMKVLDDMERKVNRSGGILPPKSLLGPPVRCALSYLDADQGNVLHIYATDGEHALDTVIDRRGLTWAAFDALPDTVDDDADRRARHAIRRIVFGALAYLSAVPSAMERSDTVRKKKRKHDDSQEPTRWEAGRTVRISPALVRAARSGDHEVALRLKYRHIVRGHYRDQPHGPKRVERRRIWIAPFWRGPEDGAELVHTYKLDNPGGEP